MHITVSSIRLTDVWPFQPQPACVCSHRVFPPSVQFKQYVYVTGDSSFNLSLDIIGFNSRSYCKKNTKLENHIHIRSLVGWMSHAIGSLDKVPCGYIYMVPLLIPCGNSGCSPRNYTWLPMNTYTNRDQNNVPWSWPVFAYHRNDGEGCIWGSFRRLSVSAKIRPLRNSDNSFDDTVREGSNPNYFMKMQQVQQISRQR